MTSVGDPARNEDLVYALLFVETFNRNEILWSWNEPKCLQADGTIHSKLAERMTVMDSDRTVRWTAKHRIKQFWAISDFRFHLTVAGTAA